MRKSGISSPDAATAAPARVGGACYTSHQKDTVHDKRRSTARATLLDLLPLFARGRTPNASESDPARCRHVVRALTAGV